MKYWFYLESYIYVELKQGKALLYNTKDGTSLEIDNQKCISLIQQSRDENNLGVIEIDESYLENTRVKDAIDSIIIAEMGRLTPVTVPEERPIILFPILSLNLDIEKATDEETKSVIAGKSVGRYLLNATIFINSSCNQECRHCGASSKQFLCCNKETDGRSFMPKETLEDLLAQICQLPTRTVNICGGDIYSYKHLDIFKKIQGDKILNFWTHYKNYTPDELIDTYKIHIFLDFPIDREQSDFVFANSKNKDFCFHAIIESDKDIDEFEQFINDYQIDDYRLHPLFNGENLHFFENAVFYGRQDILSCKISLREIFRNKKLNATSFGDLYISTDGSIRAGISTETIGYINNERIVDIIKKELISNTSWRKTREESPCIDCLLQYLCPPPSEYEKILNRQNLCK